MKVKLASLVEAIVIPSAMTTETTLSPEKTKGLQMEYLPDGLFLIIRGQRAVVPLANVKIAVFEDIEEDVRGPKLSKK